MFKKLNAKPRSMPTPSAGTQRTGTGTGGIISRRATMPCGAKHATFCAIYILNVSFYQDRLGTNIRRENSKKERPFFLRWKHLHDPECFNQINCALYDDHCLWVVPGSHSRGDTAAEVRACERQNGRSLFLFRGPFACVFVPSLSWVVPGVCVCVCVCAAFSCIACSSRARLGKASLYI